MNPAQAILNETAATVVYEDGRSEEIVLRQLKLRQLYKYIDLLAADDVPGIVALCCGKPPEWVDDVTVESFTMLSRIVVEQNFTKAMGIVENDPVAFSKCGKLLAGLAEAHGRMWKISTGSSAAPVSSGSAAETLTGSSISPPPV